jgi:hypothetical protein
VLINVRRYLRMFTSRLFTYRGIFIALFLYFFVLLAIEPLYGQISFSTPKGMTMPFTTEMWGENVPEPPSGIEEKEFEYDGILASSFGSFNKIITLKVKGKKIIFDLTGGAVVITGVKNVSGSAFESTYPKANDRVSVKCTGWINKGKHICTSLTVYVHK